ncbi:MAG: ribosome small subunit-dependent GTPase A [Gemmatimonadota bacterium]|jgi:ribosome biogenesis GTPase
MLPELPLLGFGLFFQKQLHDWPVPPLVPARIAAAHRDRYEIWSARGILDARLSGGVRRGLGDEALPGAGDWVVVEPSADPAGAAVIQGVLERRTVFVRAAAGRAARSQVVAANIDRVFVVVGLDAGANLHAIERYLARIWAGGAEPQVILNKADLAPDDAKAAAADVESRNPGLPVHVVSALAGDGLDAIRAAIQPGCTVALVGPSGAGKSTLANALLGEARLATGPVRADARGRHTTTRRDLVLLPGGGILLDTPGMRELAVVDDAGLDVVFEDIARLAEGCRFRNCRHLTEPGCAVRDAVDSGALDPDRLEHFRKLQWEAAAFERRHDVRARRQEARLWGQLEREVRQQRRWKGE